MALVKPKIIVVIPMFNCEAQIVRVLSRFTGEITPFIDTILIIDNRSEDKSVEKATAALANLIGINGFVVRNPENYGLGGSQKVGFNFAIDHHFDYVVILHGDDQGDIQDLFPLLQSNTYTQFDACLGARFMRGSKLNGYPLFRTYGNIAFNALFSLSLGKHLPDLGAGLNIYSTKILKDRFFTRFPDNLTFNYAMTLAHVHLRHKTNFFPISWREEDQLSSVRLFSQGWRVLYMLGAFIKNRTGFLQSEHRDVIRQEYLASVN